jgi:uncharacterized coiled-coil DUF342 family protein
MEDNDMHNSLTTLISLSEEIKERMKDKQKEIVGLKTQFEYLKRQYNDLQVIINKLENKIQ